MIPYQTGNELKNKNTSQFAIQTPTSHLLSRSSPCVFPCIFGSCINSRRYYSLAHSQKPASEIMFQYMHCEHTAGFKGKWTNPTSFPFFSMCLKSFGALKEIDQNSLVPFWFSSLLLERETSRNCRILLNFLLEQTLSQFWSQLYTHRSSLMMHKFKCNTSPSCLNIWRLWREEEKLNNLLDFVPWRTFG